MISFLPKDYDWRAAASWYDANAAAFVEGANGIDMTPLIDTFVSGLPSGARILDIGCGSGRDAKAFLDRGFHVEGVDPSIEMCQATHDITEGRCTVRAVGIEDMPPMHRCWDGIWMTGSLLHVPRASWQDVLTKTINSLVEGGRLFAAVKKGRGEAIDARGRPMSYAEIDDLEGVLSRACDRPHTIETWETKSSASGGEDTLWCNAILTILPGPY